MMLFFKVFFTEFIAEMGDKTQLMLIAIIRMLTNHTFALTTPSWNIEFT